jgi:hypothetical protein
MPNDVHVPVLGDVPKGSLFAGVLAAGGVGAYLYYKHLKKQASTAVAAAQPVVPPANAYGYAQYGYGAVGYGPEYGYGYGPYGYGFGAYGGGGGYYGYGGNPPITVTTNAQWAQNATTALVNQGYTNTAVLAALGAYLAGKPIQQGSSNDTIVQAAIALEGYPPVPGASGYPPAENYQGAGGGGGTIPVRVSARYDNVTGSWSKVSGATSYQVSLTQHQGAQQLGSATTAGTSYTFRNVPQKTDCAFHVTAQPGGQTGVAYTTTK